MCKLSKDITMLQTWEFFFENVVIIDFLCNGIYFMYSKKKKNSEDEPTGFTKMSNVAQERLRASKAVECTDMQQRQKPKPQCWSLWPSQSVHSQRPFSHLCLLLRVAGTWECGKNHKSNFTWCQITIKMPELAAYLGQYNVCKGF